MTITDITEATQSARDIATGAAVEVAHTASNPVRSARRQAAKLEREGAPVNEKIDRQAEKAADRVVEAAEALLPERIALQGLSLVRARARRVDLVGEVAYRSLDAVHGAIRGVMGTLTRFEKATTPPARPKRPVSKAAATTAGQTRTAGRRTARRASAAAARTARRAGSTARSTATTRRRSR